MQKATEQPDRIIRTSASESAEGFDGVLYPALLPGGRNRTDKIVITLSGSEGGLQNAERMARFLCHSGIPALAVGYFRTAHTGRDLSRIPLEYMERAIHWLQDQGYQKIAVQGISRGSDYAAAAAVTFPQITCVILRAPSWFYGEGLVKNNPSGASCWTFRGKEVPYAPFAVRHFTQQRRSEKNSGHTARQTSPLLSAAPEKITETAAIPLEQAAGPILILSTEADTVRPSAESGRILEDRLTRHRFLHAHKHISYHYMSHIMLEQASRFSREVFSSEKEFPRECARERREMGETVLHWLESVWH